MSDGEKFFNDIVLGSLNVEEFIDFEFNNFNDVFEFFRI